MIDNFNTAVIAARKLVNRFKTVNARQLATPMPVLPRPPVLGWASDSRPPCLLDQAKFIAGKEITCTLFPAKDSYPLQAYVKVYSDRAEVFVTRDETYCWRRFLAIKEICHVLMGHAGNFTPITPGDIEGLVSDIINNVVWNSSSALNVEFLAYVAAIEVLLPKEHFEEALRLAREGKTTLEIATFFRVPQRIVEWRFSDRFQRAFESVYAATAYQNVEFAAVIG